MKGFRLSVDLVAGAVFVSFGVGLILIGWGYPIGTLMRVGPGFFPKLIGWALIAVGSCELIRGLLRQGSDLAQWNFKPLIIVSGTFVLFSLLVTQLGLVITCVGVMLLAALAGPDAYKPQQLIVIAVAPVVAALLFITVLNVPLAFWPTIW